MLGPEASCPPMPAQRQPVMPVRNGIQAYSSERAIVSLLHSPSSFLCSPPCQLPSTAQLFTENEWRYERCRQTGTISPPLVVHLHCRKAWPTGAGGVRWLADPATVPHMFTTQPRATCLSHATNGLVAPGGGRRWGTSAVCGPDLSSVQVEERCRDKWHAEAGSGRARDRSAQAPALHECV